MQSISIGNRAWGILFGLFAGMMTPLTEAEATEFKRLAMDFLVQDVCIDKRGKVVAGVAPVERGERCAGRRDLALNEALPYHKHDWPGDHSLSLHSEGLQRSDSYPAILKDNNIVVHNFDYGPSAHRYFGKFDSPGDGGEVAIVVSDLVSIMFTEDAHGVNLFYGEQCSALPRIESLTSSWILFTKEILDHSEGVSMARLRSGRSGVLCPRNMDTAFTSWRILPVRFRKAFNKALFPALETIVTDHFSRSSIVSSASLERMYLTRELGWTRWERWWQIGVHQSDDFRQQDRAKQLSLSGRCEMRYAAPGESWILVDCREWTNIQPSDLKDGDAPVFWIQDVMSRDPVRQLLYAK